MTIYRGYDIVKENNVYVVYKSGEKIPVTVDRFVSEEKAMDWIDTYRRLLFKQATKA